MKRFLLTLVLLIAPRILLAADSTILALPETTTPAVTDMMYIVTDPGGAPVDNKVTLDSIKDAIVVTSHGNLNDLDVPTDHPWAVNHEDSAGAPAAGSCEGSGQIQFNTTDRVIYPCFDADDPVDIRTMTDGVTSYCFDADCETVAGYNNTVVLTSTNGSIKGVATSAGASPTKTTTINLKGVRTIEFGAADNAANDTDYLNYSGSFNSAPVVLDNPNAKATIGFTGTITEMYCKIQTAPTSTNTVIFTVATATTPAGSLGDTAMTLTITGANVQGSTTSNPIAVTKGDFVGIKKVDSASAIPSDSTICFLNLEG